MYLDTDTGNCINEIPKEEKSNDKIKWSGVSVYILTITFVSIIIKLINIF